MLFNFCHPLLRTRAILGENAVAADGHEPSNLLSDDPIRRARGFRAERFIKPPIDILLLFNIPSDVMCILAEGSSSECGLEVWVPDGNPSEGHCKYDRRLSLGKMSTSQRTVTRFRNESLWQRSESKVCLGSWLSSRPAEIIRDFPLQHTRSLFGVHTVAVRIYYLHGPSSPALQSLEVWALPNRACSRAVLNNLSEIAAKLKEGRGEKRLVHPDQSDRSAERKKSVFPEGQPLHASKRCGELRTLCQGPDEFYDKITFELMTRPMLLPSGHNVDVSTLEKLAATDRRWGREPVDPFTGVCLSANYRAEPNTGLKARIDNFILQSYGRRGENLSAGEKPLARLSDGTADASPAKIAKLDESGFSASTNDKCKGHEEMVPGNTCRGHEEMVSASLDAALQCLLGTPKPKEQASK